MLLTPLAIAAGLTLGLTRGGSFAGLRSAHVRLWPLVLLGLVLQTAEQWDDVPLRLTLYITGLFLLVVATMVNVHLRGAAITGFGLTLNLVVVVVNGYVPLRVEALQAVGGMPADADPATYSLKGLWRFEDADTALRSLGDIVPVSMFDDVISFGDLILLGGLIVLFMNLLLRRPRRGVLVDDLLEPDESFDLRERIDLDLPLVDQHDTYEALGDSRHLAAGRSEPS